MHGHLFEQVVWWYEQTPPHAWKHVVLWRDKALLACTSSHTYIHFTFIPQLLMYQWDIDLWCSCSLFFMKRFVWQLGVNYITSNLQWPCLKCLHCCPTRNLSAWVVQTTLETLCGGTAVKPGRRSRWAGGIEGRMLWFAGAWCSSWAGPGTVAGKHKH